MHQLNMCRSKKSILLSITILTVFVISFDWQYSNVILTAIRKDLHRIRANRVSQGNLIDTPGCILPKTLHFPAGFSMKKDYEPNCDFEKRIVVIDDVNEILKISEDGKISISKNESGCTLFEIHRHRTEDTFLNDNATFEITKTDALDISDKEIFGTKCGPFINFDAHFPLTETVKGKIDFWNKDEINLWTENDRETQSKPKPKSKPKPMSVLLIGFDSVSRSHFHRSLQKSLPLLTERLGFIDFKGYHSIAPNTLSNFYAILMGLTDSQVRGSCAPNWESSFDTCPLIWNHYAANNYVTMYAEDGEQSFNWAGHGGFLQKPTDYYPHPLFGSTQKYRVAHSNQSRDDSCPSTINNPNFLLDYTRRFLTKFMGVPFLSLTWFANPFHENTYSLYGLDEKLYEFFQFLQAEESRELRQNTLIILLSDHGERSGDFIHKGYYEGIIERILPGLFIRLPDNLRRDYPEHDLIGTLTMNSEHLTSGFDLHHTFLHLLQIYNLHFLDGNKNQSKTSGVSDDFEPVLQDRSSLLVPVNDQRNCADVNVLAENCMCTTNEGSIIPSAASSRMEFRRNHMLYSNLFVTFAIFELNNIIKNSKYRDVCGVHGKSAMSFHSWNVKEGAEGHTDGVLWFVTDLDKAQFDVTLRVFHRTGNSTMDMDSIERRSAFHRLNLYGDVSWCVEFETDDDKIMKGLCHCKKRES